MTPPSGAKKVMKKDPKYSSPIAKTKSGTLIDEKAEEEEEEDEDRDRAMSAQSKRNRFNMRAKRRPTGFNQKHEDSDSD